MMSATQILSKYKDFNPTITGLMAFYDWLEESGIEVPVLQIIPAQYRYDHMLVETMLNFWTALNTYFPNRFTLDIEKRHDNKDKGCSIECWVVQIWSEEWSHKGYDSLNWNLTEVMPGRALLPSTLQCGGEEDNDFVVKLRVLIKLQ